jgi:hypothetical protein
MHGRPFIWFGFHVIRSKRCIVPILSRLFGQESPRFYLDDGDQIDGLNEILVFRILRWCERSLIRLLAQFVNVGIQGRSRCGASGERMPFPA